MIEVELWQLVTFVLAGVVLGAFAAMWACARGKQPTGKPNPGTATPTAPAAAVAADASPPAASLATVPADEAIAALSAAEARKGIIKAFLNKRVVNGRNVSVDEAARCLSVSPRRIRKLMDSNVLVAIPTASSVRRVSAVSVLDLIARRGSAAAQQATSTPKPQPVVQPSREEEREEPPAIKEFPITGEARPEPRANQMYWYHVAGHDTPLRSLREALQVMGLNYVYTDWSAVPAGVKAKLRREKVVHPEDKEGED